MPLEQKNMLTNAELEYNSSTWHNAPAVIHSSSFEGQKLLHQQQLIYDE